jgi:hypothetical protein
VTVRPQELEQHFLQELDRLFKLSSASSRPRPSRSGLPASAPEHGHGQLLHTPSAADGTPIGRWETYKRIKANRQVIIPSRANPRLRASWMDPLRGPFLRRTIPSTRGRYCRAGLGPTWTSSFVPWSLRTREFELALLLVRKLGPTSGASGLTRTVARTCYINRFAIVHSKGAFQINNQGKMGPAKHGLDRGS